MIFGPGALDPAVRKAASIAGEIPGVPGLYVKKVWQRAHEITSDDITELLQIGYSEDQIFELTVSTALGAGLDRLESVLSALENEHSVSMSEYQPSTFPLTIPDAKHNGRNQSGF